ncbi:MAG: DUF3575 domain-containing protein [Prevotellaceae bacterium]|nr:DUF3575 domain-containing protein [Prevotellaceae bacterium]
MKKDYIYFTFLHEEEVRNTLIAANQVKEYRYSYSQQQIVPIVYRKNNFHKLRISLNGGWGYRTAPLSDNLSSQEKAYLKNFMSGLNIDGDISFFFHECLGVGLKFNMFTTSATTYSATERMTMPFVGPLFSTRIYDRSKRNYWIFGATIGYFGYNDRTKSGGGRASAKGSTVGIGYEVGYDIVLSENWLAGFQFSTLNGVLTRIKETVNGKTSTIELEKGSYEGLGRINLSVGLKYSF